MDGFFDLSNPTEAAYDSRTPLHSTCVSRAARRVWELPPGGPECVRLATQKCSAYSGRDFAGVIDSLAAAAVVQQRRGHLGFTGVSERGAEPRRGKSRTCPASLGSGYSSERLLTFRGAPG